MKRLSSLQKRQNAAKYKAIKKAYNRIKDRTDITYLQFKHRVIDEEIGYRLNYREAIRKEVHSHAYYTGEEIARENIVTGIKRNFKETYSKIRELSRSKEGRFQKITDVIEWDENYGAYTFKSWQFDRKTGKQIQVTYMINQTNSPRDVFITEID